MHTQHSGRRGDLHAGLSCTPYGLRSSRPRRSASQNTPRTQHSAVLHAGLSCTPCGLFSFYFAALIQIDQGLFRTTFAAGPACWSRVRNVRLGRIRARRACMIAQRGAERNAGYGFDIRLPAPRARTTYAIVRARRACMTAQRGGTLGMRVPVGLRVPRGRCPSHRQRSRITE